MEFPSPPWIPVLIIERINLKRRGYLPQIAEAANCLGSLLGSGKRRQEQRSQNRNDRYNTQKLDERECRYPPG